MAKLLYYSASSLEYWNAFKAKDLDSTQFPKPSFQSLSSSSYGLLLPLLSMTKSDLFKRGKIKSFLPLLAHCPLLLLLRRKEIPSDSKMLPHPSNPLHCVPAITWLGERVKPEMAPSSPSLIKPCIAVSYIPL